MNRKSWIHHCPITPLAHCENSSRAADTAYYVVSFHSSAPCSKCDLVYVYLCCTQGSWLRWFKVVLTLCMYICVVLRVLGSDGSRWRSRRLCSVSELCSQLHYSTVRLPTS